ncbi:integrase core domain-containing protein [Streptomyces rapamycinicus]|uniref:Integrase catalytic domain-containing protein n=2 Tax=Streptomyces rapamycinicus TaxID=1226757 RepID=A0A0A0NAA8_STRRN|nr:integrase core domain-containing protein [Streptomyces rapamycinicus]AGP54221.1 hypothetical protein M271_13135 [Streptomyces rapamycinicus NRRL 5491]MBB4781722.1 hypothetical protein [Streptomyces rapamycinicus]RLV73636.1 hypothetical protein D3C57_130460 [Streptomyces rapamycinicus NRRL 5491]UTO62297.1 integrase core domain-containing protein [Streptomyces rapamycinicus]UTP30252.1 integrase core domain-containing protein [Streptomyces rapamycinicus NRRL 5491]
MLTGLAVHALRLEEMHLTKVLHTLAELPHTARRDLGLTGQATYRMLWHAYTRLSHALETGTLAIPHNHPHPPTAPDGDPAADGKHTPCPHQDCPYEPITLSALTGRLLDASLPEEFPLTGVLAIDSTDYETWARRRAWTPEPDVDPDHPPVKDTTPPRRKRPPNEPGWPAAGHDGRLQHTIDPAAREGYRSGTNASPGNVLFDTVLKDAGIEVVLSGIQTPRMNSITERWIQTCRRELLDRTLIWNQRHLLHALREFESFYNGHRPHPGIANARPLHPLPPPIDDPDTLARLDIRRHDRLGGILHEYQHAA